MQMHMFFKGAFSISLSQTNRMKRKLMSSLNINLTHPIHITYFYLHLFLDSYYDSLKTIALQSFLHALQGSFLLHMMKKKEKGLKLIIEYCSQQ